MCSKPVEETVIKLKLVPVHFMIQQICNKAVEKNTIMTKSAPIYFLTQQMYEKAILEDSVFVSFIRDRLKTQVNCHKMLLIIILFH